MNTKTLFALSSMLLFLATSMPVAAEAPSPQPWYCPENENRPGYPTQWCIDIVADTTHRGLSLAPSITPTEHWIGSVQITLITGEVLSLPIYWDENDGDQCTVFTPPAFTSCTPSEFPVPTRNVVEVTTDSIPLYYRHDLFIGLDTNGDGEWDYSRLEESVIPWHSENPPQLCCLD